MIPDIRTMTKVACLLGTPLLQPVTPSDLPDAQQASHGNRHADCMMVARIGSLEKETRCVVVLRGILEERIPFWRRVHAAQVHGAWYLCGMVYRCRFSRYKRFVNSLLPGRSANARFAAAAASSVRPTSVSATA